MTLPSSLSLKQLEVRILATLWVTAIISFSIAVFSGYVLHRTDYFGLVALTITTTIVFVRPTWATPIVLLLLMLGAFNLLSFVYFLNVVISMGPIPHVGFQLYSLILLAVFLYYRGSWVSKIFRSSETADTKSRTKIEHFKSRFSNRPSEELAKKLNEDIVPESKLAIRELLDARQV